MPSIPLWNDKQSLGSTMLKKLFLCLQKFLHWCLNNPQTSSVLKFRTETNVYCSSFQQAFFSFDRHTEKKKRKKILPHIVTRVMYKRSIKDQMPSLHFQTILSDKMDSNSKMFTLEKQTKAWLIKYKQRGEQRRGKHWGMGHVHYFIVGSKTQ